ncbi:MULTISPECIES: dihydroneopterin aldolase [unclassified Shewanella]|uniref:dihydroneopterin aldolase n=1 Tax=unclassified Shewanella TaxID=196818 RepID=UPI000C85AFAD|nr:MULTISPECIES: dihydroneopterin aldolase [unclassified Shewanella]MDO6617450.1 dihydroneopterin aldolase [Shewanella sp. 6_MG-2023]MDO6677174.1 dihydroneopterin aldolase [Shewanella sp. 4_MG-2023]MDO6773837.1 dihydroneopterin aldolase [Shewanella sp. 3_MG-2023]PMG31368.1 dihydroneopterin aldolase [Shewanella sp. 10N.286.52.C2]PMG43116.1 dihydroneopterin aldolase [Shewanella sp. 10N.286.52.B9]
MDKVLIRELKIETVIGIYEWEKQIQQILLIDLDMAWDNKMAAATDDYQHALCYESVSNRLTALITQKPVELIETVAEMIAECLMTEFKVEGVKVTVMKPGAVPTAVSVGVVIERGQF